MRSLLYSFAALILFASTGVSLWGQGDSKATPEELALGEKVYTTHCRACHLPGGKSRIKKLNLSDDVWNHGNQLKDIEKTVSEGIEASQMQSFKSKLNPEEITAVAKYVLSLGPQAQAGSQ